MSEDYSGFQIFLKYISRGFQEFPTSGDKIWTVSKKHKLEIRYMTATQRDRYQNFVQKMTVNLHKTRLKLNLV